MVASAALLPVFVAASEGGEVCENAYDSGWRGGLQEKKTLTYVEGVGNFWNIPIFTVSIRSALAHIR